MSARPCAAASSASGCSPRPRPRDLREPPPQALDAHRHVLFAGGVAASPFGGNRARVGRPLHSEAVNGATCHIIPLGGLGEVGKNMTAFECEDRILVVDAGLAFPRDEHLGVD